MVKKFSKVIWNEMQVNWPFQKYQVAINVVNIRPISMLEWALMQPLSLFSSMPTYEKIAQELGIEDRDFLGMTEDGLLTLGVIERRIGKLSLSEKGKRLLQEGKMESAPRTMQTVALQCGYSAQWIMDSPMYNLNLMAVPSPGLPIVNANAFAEEVPNKVIKSTEEFREITIKDCVTTYFPVKVKWALDEAGLKPILSDDHFGEEKGSVQEQLYQALQNGSLPEEIISAISLPLENCLSLEKSDQDAYANSRTLPISKLAEEVAIRARQKNRFVINHHDFINLFNISLQGCNTIINIDDSLKTGVEFKVTKKKKSQDEQVLINFKKHDDGFTIPYLQIDETCFIPVGLRNILPSRDLCGFMVFTAADESFITSGYANMNDELKTLIKAGRGKKQNIDGVLKVIETIVGISKDADQWILGIDVIQDAIKYSAREKIDSFIKWKKVYKSLFGDDRSKIIEFNNHMTSFIENLNEKDFLDDDISNFAIKYHPVRIIKALNGMVVDHPENLGDSAYSQTRVILKKMNQVITILEGNKKFQALQQDIHDLIHGINGIAAKAFEQIYSDKDIQTFNKLHELIVASDDTTTKGKDHKSDVAGSIRSELLENWQKTVFNIIEHPLDLSVNPFDRFKFHLELLDAFKQKFPRDQFLAENWPRLKETMQKYEDCLKIVLNFKKFQDMIPSAYRSEIRSCISEDKRNMVNSADVEKMDVERLKELQQVSKNEEDIKAIILGKIKAIGNSPLSSSDFPRWIGFIEQFQNVIQVKKNTIWKAFLNYWPDGKKLENKHPMYKTLKELGFAKELGSFNNRNDDKESKNDQADVTIKKIVVDGNNVAKYQLESGNAEIERLLLVRDQLSKFFTNENIKIFVSAALRHNCDDESLLKKLVMEGVVLEAPAKRSDDYFIIKQAMKDNAFILSNDTFTDWQEKHKDLKSNITDRRVSFIYDMNEKIFSFDEKLEPLRKEQ